LSWRRSTSSSLYCRNLYIVEFSLYGHSPEVQRLRGRAQIRARAKSSKRHNSSRVGWLRVGALNHSSLLQKSHLKENIFCNADLTEDGGFGGAKFEPAPRLQLSLISPELLQWTEHGPILFPLGVPADEPLRSGGLGVGQASKGPKSMQHTTAHCNTLQHTTLGKRARGPSQSMDTRLTPVWPVLGHHCFTSSVAARR